MPGVLLTVILLQACGDAGAAPGSDALLRPPAEISDEELRAIHPKIVYVSEGSGLPRARLTRPDGTADRPLLVDERATYPAAVSPDGRRVAVVAVEEVEDSGRTLHLERLLEVPVDGGPVRQIGPEAGRVRNPVWAPDGAAVFFESDIASFRDIYSADGRTVTQLTAAEHGNFEPSISPDGGAMVFVSSRDGNAEVYRSSIDGSDPVRLTAFHLDDVSPAWSPDGRKIAFLSDREGAARIYSMSPHGTFQKRVTADALPPAIQEESFAWSPDGSRIAIVRRDSMGVAMLTIADVETGGVVPLFEGGENPVWSPDGHYLAFNAPVEGVQQVYIARADGTAAAVVTRAAGPNWLPRWIPRDSPDR